MVTGEALAVESADGDGKIMLEEVPTCVLCGSSSSTFLFQGRDRLHGLPGEFGAVRCDNCSLVRLSPRPVIGQIGRYYPENDYYSYISDEGSINQVSSGGFSGKIRQAVMHRLGYPTPQLAPLLRSTAPILEKLFIDRATYGWGKRFPKFKENGAALDIGCGNGKYLSFLKHHGWNVRGVEIGEAGANAAKELFDIDVYVGPLETAPFAQESFDHITMFHSLEHVYEPPETVARVYELLKRDGVFYVEVPNVESFGARIDGEYWFHWDMPRHLWGFSKDSLRKLVERAGFRVVEMTTIHEPSHEWAITYRNEQASGHQSEKRPAVSGFESLEAKRKKLMSKVAYTFDRMSGNYLCCWMTK